MSTDAIMEKQKRQLPIEILWVSGQYDTKDDVHSRTIKKHLQNLAQCINGGNSITIY